MSWKNLTIGKKIATGFGLIIVFLIILGAEPGRSDPTWKSIIDF